MPSTSDFRPVILAGGSGTRFWPRSRKARAKQVLALDGERTMIQHTLDRLLPLAPPQSAWVITNDLLSSAICIQLDEVLGIFPGDHFIGDEPQFLETLRRGIALAAAGENIVVLGVLPTRAETG